MCRTLVLDGFFLSDCVRALSADSQSKTEWTERALNGDGAGDLRSTTEGLGGTLKLGKVAGPKGGADMGATAGLKGVGGAIGAVAGGSGFSSFSLVAGEDWAALQEQSESL